MSDFLGVKDKDIPVLWTISMRSWTMSMRWQRRRWLHWNFFY
jgi:hypothetical protein